MSEVYRGCIAPKPRLLDLFCGQGGAGTGYHRAGFDVTGVDIVPQPRYPFEFHQADALEYLAEHGAEYDAVHASPPCQDHSTTRSFTSDHGTGWMLRATIEALEILGLPYVVENVGGADLDGLFRLVLCGSMFGLGAVCDDGSARQLRRHRQFVTNVMMMQANCQHAGPVVGVYGHGPQRGSRGYGGNAREAAEALGIDWMTRDGLSQSIPPAYCQFIGEQILDALGHGVERLRRDSSRAHTRDNDAFPGRRTDFHPSTDVLSGNESFARSLQSRFVASEGYLSELSRGQDAQD